MAYKSRNSSPSAEPRTPQAVFSHLALSTAEVTCTSFTNQLTMRVVAMVALWSLVQAAVSECWYGCHLVNISIAVEMGDGSTCSVETQGCAGMCHNREPVYVSPSGQTTQQTSCHYWEWTYEPVPDYCYTRPGLEYQNVPKALSCACSSCNTDNYDCSTLSPSLATCSTYESLKHHI